MEKKGIDGELFDTIEVSGLNDNKNSLPNEKHDETVVLLGKNAAKSKSYVKLGLDVDDYHRIKDSEKGSE